MHHSDPDIHAAEDSRDSVTRILRGALEAVEPRVAVRHVLQREGERLRIGEDTVELGVVNRVFLIGAGKAVCAMAQGVFDTIPERVASGTITTKDGYAAPVPEIDLWEAAHPVPDSRGLAGAARALEIARGAGSDDLVLCLLSGGASALWPAPSPGISLTDVQRVTDALLRSGAPIQELNAVRKHLSRISGGQLARIAHPARVFTLVISDVVGSPLDVIGSGPTVPDPTTYDDALEIIRRRKVEVPPAVSAHLQAGAAGTVPETPKPGDPVFERTRTHVVARNHDALEGAARTAEQLGYEPRIITDRMEGEARNVAQAIIGHALQARSERRMAGKHLLALLWGGETTVTVKGAGRGGRNQELALAAAMLLDGMEGITLAALGTDGTDGPTDAAGGIVDGGTVGRARAAGLDPRDHLRRNDAYPFLRAAGNLLMTGPTGTNVNDLVLVLVTGPS